jgi:hypothetical protein
MKIWAILGVVFALGTAFSGYWTAASMHSAPPAPATLLDYLEDSHYTYRALLAPNSLYNTTTLGPGNGTLFTAITLWVNVSFGFDLHTNAPANLSTLGTFTASIVTPAWTKELSVHGLRVSSIEGSNVELRASYNASVPGIAATVTAIDKETGYTPPYYLIALRASLATTVETRGVTTDVVSAPALTLNVSAGQIRPSALTSSGSGVVSAPDPAAAGAVHVPALVPSFVLVACVVGLAFSGTFAYREWARGRPHDLPALMAPYEEAIVDVRGPPVASSTIQVKAWEDIVKVADTIGMPILRTVRVAPGADAAPTTVFYVVAGGTAYVFVHRPGETAPTLPAGSVVAPPAVGAAPTSRADPWQRKFPRIPGADPSSLDSFVEWTERIGRRASLLAPDSPLRHEAEELIVKGIGLARRGELDSAWVVLGQAYGRLGPWASSAPSAGREPAVTGRNGS